MKILCLSSGQQNNLRTSAEKKGHSIDVFNPAEFNIFLSSNPKGYDSIFYNESDKLLRKDYDVIISRIGSNRLYASAVLQQLQYNMNIFALQSGKSINICADKIHTAQILSAYKLPVPKQFFCISPKDIAFLIKKLGDLPVILKEITGSKGANIILLESPLQTNMTLESYYKKGTKFILQQYLNNGGKDERHIVIGDKVVCSMERQAPKNDIRANVSLAGTAKKIQATDQVKELCIKAVQSIPGLNFAGVDIIIDADGKPYIIEINSNPGEQIINICDYNYFTDVIEFCENNYKSNKNHSFDLPAPSQSNDKTNNSFSKSPKADYFTASTDLAKKLFKQK